MYIMTLWVSFFLSGICLTLWADEWCRIYLLDQTCGWSVQIWALRLPAGIPEMSVIGKLNIVYHLWEIRATWGFDTCPCICCIPGLDVTHLGHWCYHIPEWDGFILQVFPPFVFQILVIERCPELKWLTLTELLLCYK